MRYNRRHYERLRDTDHAEELVQKITNVVYNPRGLQFRIRYEEAIRYLIYSYLDVIKE